jgi:hypothetical protein
MESQNVETHRAGHEAFNQRDFAAMTKLYADSITWTDHSRAGRRRGPVLRPGLAAHAAGPDATAVLTYRTSAYIVRSNDRTIR